MSAKSVQDYKASEEKRQREREEAEQNSLFREIDDDLRHENLSNLWSRYGKLVIGGAVAIVIAVSGYQVHNYMQETERQEQGAVLDSAYTAIENGKSGEATKFLESLEATGSAGYRTLARLKQATMLLDQGKIAEGRGKLQAVSADADVLAAYRDLAVVLDAMAGLDTDAPSKIEDQVAPMTAAGHPWRHMALQLTALAAAKAGEPQRAADVLKDILDDPDTLPAQRQMASNLRTVFLQDAEANTKSE